jgi:peptidyl-prolyl cis-trans isomerase B (cyclophilin B)
MIHHGASIGRGLVSVVTLIATLSGCAAKTPSLSPGPTLAPIASAGGAASSAPSACPTSQPPALPPGETRTVTITTSKGAIAIKVEGALSPIAAGNFVALAQCGFYTGVVFHRVVPRFVIQGGDGQYGRSPVDPTRVGTGGPGYTIQDEAVTATYARGVVAMARTQQPNSQGSQFFIVLDDSAAQSLAAANTYALFGHVTTGMDAVDAIAAAADAEIPTHPIAMDAVTVAKP